jgi:hypothetical protein
MPPLPDPNFGKFGHGVSLLGGWLPLSIVIGTVIVLVIAIGWRTRRWRVVWVPIAVVGGIAVAFGTRIYMNSQGLASDPAPLKLWVWAATFAASVALAALGFRSARWWRGALPDLCAAAVAVDIGCSLRGISRLSHLAVRGPGVLQCVAVAGAAGAHARSVSGDAPPAPNRR